MVSYANAKLFVLCCPQLTKNGQLLSREISAPTPFTQHETISKENNSSSELFYFIICDITMKKEHLMSTWQGVLFRKQNLQCHVQQINESPPQIQRLSNAQYTGNSDTCSLRMSSTHTPQSACMLTCSNMRYRMSEMKKTWGISAVEMFSLQ